MVVSSTSQSTSPAPDGTIPVTLQVNGTEYPTRLDPRTSLLDALREHIGLTGTKKGCNQGACGACTVLVDGERINSCLTLAAQYAGKAITTVEGLATAGKLSSLQAAFIEYDGFQCGYCTPGQLCSATAMIDELKQGMPSAVSPDITAETFELTESEIKERMSGNVCRCGAYNGIVDAIRQAVESNDKPTAHETVYVYTGR